MPKFIIRLDDACPTMNSEKWQRMEDLLDKYNITPMVGIIPLNEDESFSYDENPAFWDKARNWQKKNWTICLHGFHHTLQPHPASGYFQRCVETATEMAGRSVEEQKEMLEKGLAVFEEQQLWTECFFAPAHTFDAATVEAAKQIPQLTYISDGYAFRAYSKNGFRFLPTLFDTPHSIAGVQTFVYHPNQMDDFMYEYLENFIRSHEGQFINATDYMASVGEKPKGQGLIGRILELGMFTMRRIRMRG